MTQPIRIAVTGAAGQITYSLLFRLASGEVFGPDRPVVLQLLELPQVMGVLEGVAMELQDCAFPTLAGVRLSDNADEAFEGANHVLMVGSRPRGPGMERADLIRVNGPIFVGQGKALDRAAADVRILVVGNPCNTNCMIAMNHCGVPKERFSAMMRLDQNRAKSFLAHKAGLASVAGVSHLVIWGNHSNNQYPDFENARIGGKPAAEVIADEVWLRGTFVESIQQRGAVVIKARGNSSAASAANAAIDQVRSFLTPTPAGDWFSAAVLSSGEYGVDPGLVFGFPLTGPGDGSWRVVEGLGMSEWARGRFNKVLDELRAEREVVKDLLA